MHLLYAVVVVILVLLLLWILYRAFSWYGYHKSGYVKSKTHTVVIGSNGEAVDVGLDEEAVFRNVMAEVDQHLAEVGSNGGSEMRIGLNGSAAAANVDQDMADFYGRNSTDDCHTRDREECYSSPHCVYKQDEGCVSKQREDISADFGAMSLGA